MNMLLTKVRWDKGESPVDLPETVLVLDLPDDFHDYTLAEEKLSDMLSDVFGYFHFGYLFREYTFQEHENWEVYPSMSVVHYPCVTPHIT